MTNKLIPSHLIQLTMTKPNYVVYPAVFDNENNDGYYTVTFPDIPDTATDGKTLVEAIKNAPDALAIALPDYSKYPKPTPVEQVQLSNPGKLVNLIGVDMKAARRKAKNVTVRKNVTIPMSLATAAKEKGINFSETLTEALEEKLEL
ncbi:type II toxin-antitoxin system HicB family antitoxin [Pediococcus inopinatus]|uniref:Type II toxin-antitoxin system HicB family antitoxin n=1 Tax=Pediococcus inopinatus TaxID=114090 RepID=A0ABZ0Q4K9_9LACO|nr:type II toxin-antitoxin system HicB family antitoxin [Pediococcus inopinatus]WPC16967.1 type II toxin-antitoxin system HicB family antitoxin [Pediococcus inopinatus]WPC19914.1 type II toxin-antitoxin system HicB family antitoxin [Pediococcus inopinatus]WPC21614.1 type II toxin-antitoxin system HicB family antitoxin [Pediococcus inopinatus]WPP09453.1 type II toxin-antitoxin system HicB family antitoxin [Pediococcus inopinatus]